MKLEFQSSRLFSGFLFSVLLALCLILLSQTKAQADYINLPVPNIQQDTEVWCWAAVAEEIVLGVRGRKDTPRQCHMVAIAKNASPAVCCANFNACKITGGLEDIQRLILHFGGRPSSIQPPANPYVLFQTLQSGRPIILQINPSGMGMSHVVVLRGMDISNAPWGPRATLFINDPLIPNVVSVDFSQIVGIWQAAIVVD